MPPPYPYFPPRLADARREVIQLYKNYAYIAYSNLLPLYYLKNNNCLKIEISMGFQRTEYAHTIKNNLLVPFPYTYIEYSIC